MSSSTKGRTCLCMQAAAVCDTTRSCLAMRRGVTDRPIVEIKLPSHDTTQVLEEQDNLGHIALYLHQSHLIFLTSKYGHDKAERLFDPNCRRRVSVL